MVHTLSYAGGRATGRFLNKRLPGFVPQPTGTALGTRKFWQECLFWSHVEIV
jgi:hypothetical protein